MSTIFSLGVEAATAAAGAVTVDDDSRFVKITTEALTTAAGAAYTLTITAADIKATDLAFASVALGSSDEGDPRIKTVTPGAGSVVVVVGNDHATEALNGTLKISVATFGS